MRKVNIHEAKTTLSQLVQAVEAGERVMLARAGRPIAELVRVEKPRGIRLGVLKGKVPAKLMRDLIKPLSEAELAAFLSGPESA
jgi:prevent-host-death family protein